MFFFIWRRGNSNSFFEQTEGSCSSGDQILIPFPFLILTPITNPSLKSSNPLPKHLEAIEALKSLLQQKLKNGEDEEALTILKLLVSTQPQVTDWKFMIASLSTEMGQTENARTVFEEILQSNPLSFDALFENALLMYGCGEGKAVKGPIIKQRLVYHTAKWCIRELSDFH
ncbi:protein SLOW GREEN 1, chloroplastic-like [Durio zibethinus]|uniref:Protein SLOW GREEN 1, chloroplastic-like n=1 Tax=Durio zibethinus TaxID=66656 RepID=A0A6P5X9Q3_DURZI|nr:protein SLOW GREEN 1, chloroplastic-like [Durio zibethinus]